MKRVTLSFYLIPNGKGGTKRTTYRLSPEEAAQRYPGAAPCPHDAITVDQPETISERKQAMYTRTTSRKMD